MNLASTATRRLAGVGALAAAVLAASFAGGAATVSAAPSSGTWSTSSVGCLPGDLSLGSPSGARVAEGATAQEPKLYPDNEAKAVARMVLEWVALVIRFHVRHRLLSHTNTKRDHSRWHTQDVTQGLHSSSSSMSHNHTWMASIRFSVK